MKRIILYCLQLVLSIIFIYAAITKLQDRQVFYDSILAYQLIGPQLAKPIAHVIPYLELILALGLWRNHIRLASYAIYSLLVITFTALKVYAYAVGLDLSCSCFGKLVPMSQLNGIYVNVAILFTLLAIYKLSPKTK